MLQYNAVYVHTVQINYKQDVAVCCSVCTDYTHTGGCVGAAGYCRMMQGVVQGVAVCCSVCTY